jgi:hypothetical protein
MAADLASSRRLAVFATAGSSMEPMLPGGSFAEIAVLSSRLFPGDLLAFLPHTGREICCHRVIAVSAHGAALTRGDRSGICDGWVEPEHFVGVVRRYKVGGRWYATVPLTKPNRYRRLRQRLERGVGRLAARWAPVFGRTA